jgi:indolepyruvate ferredoxin oxidoreductase beta subunit
MSAFDGPTEAAPCRRSPSNGDRANIEIRLVIAGIGGQGVVFATKLLSQAGLARGAGVIASENHGMSQRGGSVMSHLKIGGSDAPLISRGTADALVGLDRSEAIRNLTFVRQGGAVFVNSANGLDDTLRPRLDQLGIGVNAIDAARCAAELGSPAVVNLVVLGFAAAHPEFGITVSELEDAVRALGPAAAVERNLQALAAGARAR